MMRFLNELNSFRKSIELAPKPAKRSRSRITHSERSRQRINNTQLDVQQHRPLRQYPSFCCNTQRNLEAPVVSRKNSKRHKASKKNSARRRLRDNKENLEIRIEEDPREPSPPTNKQLVSRSTKARNEIHARINESYNRNNDYFQKQLIRQRFTKTLAAVHRCLCMLPVVNEQCVIGTIGEQLYYFLGSVLFRMVKLRCIDLSFDEFFRQCECIFEKATAAQIASVNAAAAGILGVATNPTLGTESLPMRTPTANNTIVFDTDNYLMRQATSVNSSTKKTTNASIIRQSNRRQREILQPPAFVEESLRVRTNSHEGRLRRKQAYHFDKQQVLEEESALLKLNDRLEQYIAKHHLRN